jgi:peptide/nickel transport system substrate-binding protein
MPTIQTFEYVYLPEMSTQVAELMVGNIDWVWRISKEDQDRLAGVPNIQATSAGSLRNNFMVFDAFGSSGETPFTDIRVRQAVAHAIDREAIVRELVPGGTGALHEPCHHEQFGCPSRGSLPIYEYDPDKARALLAEAGYPDGFTAEFWVLETRPRIWIETVQAYLRDVGITAQLRPVGVTQLYEGTANTEIPFMFTNSGSNSIRDVSALWGPFFGTRRDIVRDDELTAWVEEASATVNGEVRLELYQRVGERIIERLYWLPLWIEGTGYAFHEDLEYTPWDDENPRFYFARWKD